MFLRDIKARESHENPTTSASPPAETETSPPASPSKEKQIPAPLLVRQQFNNIVQQISRFTETIPLEDQGYLAGQIYNIFLKESSDPNTSLSPEKLTIPKPDIFFGIGVAAVFYETENKKLNLVIDPIEGSPAQMAGLKKGDFVLSVGDFDIRKSSPDIETYENLMNKLRGPKDSQIELKIQSFCDNQERYITITREPIYYFPDWLKDNRDVNLHQLEPLDCKPETGSVSDTEIGQRTHGEPIREREVSDSPLLSPQPTALYIPLKHFYSSNAPPPSDQSVTPLCSEFLNLQIKDLRNAFSLGMIIDLRGNPGGYLHEVSCLLNTLISDDGVIVREQPVEEGNLLEIQGQTPTYYFTRGGALVDSRGNPVIYNKNIVVLVDGESASAAEVFAGTLQEMKRGWVVGDRTSGKGSVQNPVPLYVTRFHEPLQLNLTTAIYTLNSGRSPQGYGIIPDFRFFENGEPIEEKPDDISSGDRFIFDDIPFENNQWKQNRPEELAQLKECIENNPQSVSESLKKKIREDKKYDRPFIADYSLELAKDILTCLPPRPDTAIQPYYSPPQALLRIE